MPDLLAMNKTDNQNQSTISKIPVTEIEGKTSVLALKQYILKFMNATRRPIAHTKTRTNVRGGGRKPWRQKGTGRARVSSIRSPLWRGGGITFGPLKERNFSQKINKKIAQSALLTALVGKAESEHLHRMPTLNLEKISTKILKTELERLNLTGRIMLVVSKLDVTLMHSAANLAGVEVKTAARLNVYNILNSDEIVFIGKSFTELMQRRGAGPERAAVQTREASEES